MIGDGALVVVPTFNERENIEALATQILEAAPGAHLLVIDDHSPDGTADLVKRVAARDGRVSVLERPGKLGLGTAYMEGFRHGLEHGFEHVITMDADFSHHPRYLPDILEAAVSGDTELVIGSRYVKGGSVVGWAPQRRVLSFGANLFARLVLGLRARDCTGGYRCYSRRAFQRLEGANIVAHGYSALIELIWHCDRSGYYIVEVPITFVDRVLGESKVSGSEIGRGVTTVLRMRLRRQKTAKVTQPQDRRVS